MVMEKNIIIKMAMVIFTIPMVDILEIWMDGMENNEGIIVLKLCLAGIQPMYFNFCNRNIPKKFFLKNVAKMDFILI